MLLRIFSMVVCGLVFCSTPLAWAQTSPLDMPDPETETPLDETELNAAFSDKTHRGTYNFKRPKIETFSFEETTSSDGRTRHVHGSKVDVGTWMVRGDIICFDYEDWSEGNHRACFKVFKRGNCFYHWNVRATFSGIQGSFTARSVHKGDDPDCEPSIA